MTNSLPFFDHSHHKLTVRGSGAALDVLSFEGEEWLSSPFKYDIQFTSTDKNIDPTTMLMQDASLTLQAPSPKPLASQFSNRSA
ncbi:hypothetical protein [Rahnella inusitata]|uniref:hypothetical protein n=1 Tax=Rahnella inusitata TaxID=58169 RepID=UPI0039AFCDB9